MTEFTVVVTETECYTDQTQDVQLKAEPTDRIYHVPFSTVYVNSVV